MFKFRYKLIIFALIFAGLFCGAYGAAKSDFDPVYFTVNAIKNYYVEDVSLNQLVNGGVSGLKKYMVTNKKDDSSIKNISSSLGQEKQIQALYDYYTAVLNENTDLNAEKTLESIINGILDSLQDQFSSYLNPKEYKRLSEQMEGGNFGGIGASIELDPANNNALTILKPLDGTPAFKAGLQSGDVIAKISNKPTNGISIEMAQSLLRGKIGTKVSLTILRRKENKTFDLTITRALIHIRSLSYKVLDNDIGYIKVDIFGENTSTELEEALNYLENKKVKGYILDLRNNGGGYIDTSVFLCSKFMPTDSVVTSIKGRAVPEVIYKSLPNPRAILPVVVLINQYSASASEITAAAFSSVGSNLVGEKSFGKATVQKVIPYNNGAALKLTTAYYYTPAGKNINKIGIEPNMVVKMDIQAKEESDDVQLKKAVEVLKVKIRDTSQFLRMSHVT